MNAWEWVQRIGRAIPRGASGPLRFAVSLVLGFVLAMLWQLAETESELDGDDA